MAELQGRADLRSGLEFACQIVSAPKQAERLSLFRDMRESCCAAEIAASFYQVAAAADKFSVLEKLDFLPHASASAGTRTVASYYFKAGMGGADKVMCELANMFAAEGYRSVLLCDEEVDAELVSPDVECIVLPPFQQAGPDNYIERAAALQHALELYQVDVLVYHQWLSHVLPWDLMVAKLSGARFVVHTHGSCTVFPRYRIDDFYTLPLAYRQADAVVCLSSLDCGFWSLANRNVYRTINPARFQTADTPVSPLKGKTVLWIGRLDPIEKRPEEALRVMSELHKIDPGATLVMVGGGTPEYERHLVTLAKDYGIDGCVEFMGEQDDPRPYFERASALLVTSPFEGYSLVLAEAKVFGLPCVLYDLPNIVFQEKPRGVVPVRQLDSRAAADELARLLADDAYRAQMGEAARAQAEEFESFDRAGFWKGVINGSATPYVPEDSEAAADRLWNLFWRESGDSMRAANERVANLERQVQELGRRIEELESSTTMRVGKAATFLPRAIKDRLPRR